MGGETEVGCKGAEQLLRGLERASAIVCRDGSGQNYRYTNGLSNFILSILGMGMTRDETIAFFEHCEAARAEAKKAALNDGKSEDEARAIGHDAAKAIWNAWAEELIDKRKELEAKEHFKIGVVSRPRWYEWLPNSGIGVLFPENEETTAWHEKSCIDFSEYVFGIACDFSGFLFPGESIFVRAQFQSNVSFENAIFSYTTNFMHADFHEWAVFRRALFSEIVIFESSNFHKWAIFKYSVFEKECWFNRAKFYRIANFEKCTLNHNARFFMCTFQDAAWFEESIFNSIAEFGRAKFLFTANFTACKFLDNSPARFVQSGFEEYTVFEHCYFQNGADFRSCRSEKFFHLGNSVFGKVPRFNQADFKQAPDMDDVVYPLPNFWSGNDKYMVSAYRALRRLAVQGHDHENEAKAFKGEIRSKRGTEHKPWHLVFWFGVFYDVVSDFGRSAVRPLLMWVFFIFGFGFYYFYQALIHSEAWHTCIQQRDDPLAQALLVSIKNAFVVFATSRDPRVVAAYECVYGIKRGSPDVPLPVTLVEMLVQVPMSAALIFLFLLAVRNQFKIK